MRINNNDNDDDNKNNTDDNNNTNYELWWWWKSTHWHNNVDTEAKLNWESIREVEAEKPEWND